MLGPRSANPVFTTSSGSSRSTCSSTDLCLPSRRGVRRRPLFKSPIHSIPSYILAGTSTHVTVNYQRPSIPPRLHPTSVIRSCQRQSLKRLFFQFHVTSISIMSTLSVLLGLALAANAVIAAPSPAAIQARSVIGHDDVVGFAETVPSTTEGSLMLTYKPLLKVFNGCVPFPAVDASGNTGYAPVLTDPFL